MSVQHIPVLLNEVIAGLDIKPDDVFLDGTINGGGHSKAVYDKLGTKGLLIGTDLDEMALGKAREKLQGGNAKVILKQSSFRNLDTVLGEIGRITVNKILLDLGLSSNQFEESGRGFTFQKDEPLLMTFKSALTESDLTAKKIVNEWDEENIAQIIESYGEEHFARKIAHAIVFYREKKEIKTTNELVAIIKEAVPQKYQHGRIHPATKTFQALRITTNDEIESLKDGLRKGFEHLALSGRMAVISFHSIEDRIVKNFFRERVKEGTARLITKKPITPSQKEITENPRSRSAKLRIIEKWA
ncbi:MAG: Ribosomal RNA small subunit methyltransferase H [Candidatus Magasanikbacteria bacterium GW2011_GWA2_46_17]|uniref:Ribosomal RNA small subunit methyltransferase H n=1 Tax=Candidatus Magasanikbacteria bacterium GW2011_GWA2_46_17 TaxID=1619042 RepID=A0A0G1P0F2_9BACT|nr:MAG: Ribosomal RNA small subunit methyltransferase H [Candidatus Magasanikbacteria bacterium GW2011_GWA2_46_17]